MSTRALIGILNDDSSVDYIYNHFDGYIEDGLGDYLYDHFSSADEVRELIDNGHASSVMEQRYYGEEYSSVFTFVDFQGEVTDGIDYGYLWKDGKWLVSHSPEHRGMFMSLEQAMQEII